ncbi:MAG: hypothetical protein II882_01325 [Lachnospiraceae bacterium]|nr:hypothetical protein [Lachnospiraceae bacterium]
MKNTKKLFTLLLCLLLALSMAACGVKKDTETDKTETKTSETTAEETTEEPTTEAWLTDRDAKAEDVYQGMLDFLNTKIKELKSNKKPEEFVLSGTASGSVKVSLFIPKTESNEEINLSMYAKGSGEAQVDVKQGAHAYAEYETDYMKFLAVLYGQDPEAVELMKGTYEVYLDQTERKQYTKAGQDEDWEMEELGPEEEPDESESQDEQGAQVTSSLSSLDFDPEKYPLDKVFKEYTFTVTKEEYIFEGTLNTNLITDSETVSGQFGNLDLSGMEPKVRITCDPEKRPTSFSVTVGTYELPLDNLMPIEGMKVKLEALSVNFNLSYDDFTLTIPEEVKQAAED